MLFQTWPFIIFFAVLYPTYLLARATKARLALLLVSSYLFYAWLGPLYLVPLAVATLVDYLVVARMVRSTRKKFWLSLSILSNLGLLVFCKYSEFITENLNLALSSAGVTWEVPPPGFLLPAGLSFYLLQSLGYVIDTVNLSVNSQDLNGDGTVNTQDWAKFGRCKGDANEGQAGCSCADYNEEYFDPGTTNVDIADQAQFASQYNLSDCP